MAILLIPAILLLAAAEGDVVNIDAVPLQFAQVRIEQRIIIRIPRTRDAQSMRATDVIDNIFPDRLKEKKIGKCLPVTNLLGVQLIDGNSIDLLTRDRKRVRAHLEKGCQVNSFYSGFYVEKSPDGQICVNRDLLHSRSGSKCEIAKFREMVPK